MDEDLETPEAKTFFMECMHDPSRNYCDGRFLSLAAELVRMGHKPRIVAQAGLTVGVQQALEESWDYYDQFMQRLGDMSQRAAERLAFEIEQADKAGPTKAVRY